MNSFAIEAFYLFIIFFATLAEIKIGVFLNRGSIFYETKDLGHKHDYLHQQFFETYKYFFTVRIIHFIVINLSCLSENNSTSYD